MVDMKIQAWSTLENIISPEPHLREIGLEELEGLDEFEEHPLILYILATRILDPDLEIRFHAVKLLGKVLEQESEGVGIPEKSLRAVAAFLSDFDQAQLIKLLDVSVKYLSAEDALIRIFKLCSYAGKVLSGIVNDRTLPAEIRQQAIHFCGEVGFLSSISGIRNLIQRVEKNRFKAGPFISRKKHLDEESLVPFAVTALGKLEGP
jgi:hypothetical protein